MSFNIPGRLKVFKCTLPNGCLPVVFNESFLKLKNLFMETMNGFDGIFLLKYRQKTFFFHENFFSRLMDPKFSSLSELHHLLCCRRMQPKLNFPAAVSPITYKRMKRVFESRSFTMIWEKYWISE